MPGYPGRAADYDLGAGHSAAWDDGGATLTERHGYGPCGGWHGFGIDLSIPGMLAAGGPGDEAHLTVAVPLTCPLCGITGRVTAGRWVPG
jgi:hypothetical protein